MTGISSVISDAPEVTVTNARPLEKDLYKKVWDMPEYRKVAPGEKVAHEFPFYQSSDLCHVFLILLK